MIQRPKAIIKITTIIIIHRVAEVESQRLCCNRMATRVTSAGPTSVSSATRDSGNRHTLTNTFAFTPTRNRIPVYTATVRFDKRQYSINIFEFTRVKSPTSAWSVESSSVRRQYSISTYAHVIR